MKLDSLNVQTSMLGHKQNSIVQGEFIKRTFFKVLGSSRFFEFGDTLFFRKNLCFISRKS